MRHFWSKSRAWCRMFIQLMISRCSKIGEIGRGVFSWRNDAHELKASEARTTITTGVAGADASICKRCWVSKETSCLPSWRGQEIRIRKHAVLPCRVDELGPRGRVDQHCSVAVSLPWTAVMSSPCLLGFLRAQKRISIKHLTTTRPFLALISGRSRSKILQSERKCVKPNSQAYDCCISFYACDACFSPEHLRSNLRGRARRALFASCQSPI